VIHNTDKSGENTVIPNDLVLPSSRERSINAEPASAMKVEGHGEIDRDLWNQELRHHEESPDMAG
jgi:hypothetical protein